MPEIQTTNKDGKVRCSECGLQFVPSPIFDFYPDDSDPTKGLCESCMVRSALADVASTHNPTHVSEDRVERVCKRGEGALACSFLGATGGGFACLKGSGFESIIVERRRDNSIRAMGDNCSGPPDFIVRA